MGLGSLLDALSKRAPVIVVVALMASLIGAWTRAPDRLVYALAIFVGSLALVLWAGRGLPRQFKSKETLGFNRNRDLIAYELAGKGAPRGYHLLGAIGISTMFVVGIQSAYGVLAFAGFMLGVVWGIANARYPADQIRSES